MKKYADKNRSFREFQVGDNVFLKLQPYIQSSVAPRANHKLLFKYYGPFRVIAKISEVAYKLDLPEGSTVHPVFHVSLLRQALSSGTQVSSTLPHLADVLSIPIKILSRRWRKKANTIVEQVLIQWSTGDAASATWEDREELQGRFPAAPAWGQADSKGRRGVRYTTVPDTAHDSPDERNDQGAASNSSVNSEAANISERPRRNAKPNPRFYGPSWSK
jgi:ribosomal protein L21E